MPLKCRCINECTTFNCFRIEGVGSRSIPFFLSSNLFEWSSFHFHCKFETLSDAIRNTKSDSVKKENCWNGKSIRPTPPDSHFIFISRFSIIFFFCFYYSISFSWFLSFSIVERNGNLSACSISFFFFFSNFSSVPIFFHPFKRAMHIKNKEACCCQCGKKTSNINVEKTKESSVLMAWPLTQEMASVPMYRFMHFQFIRNRVHISHSPQLPLGI